MANPFGEYALEYFRFITTSVIDPTNKLADLAIRFVILDRHLNQGTTSRTTRTNSQVQASLAVPLVEVRPSASPGITADSSSAFESAFQSLLSFAFAKCSGCFSQSTRSSPRCFARASLLAGINHAQLNPVLLGQVADRPRVARMAADDSRLQCDQKNATVFVRSIRLGNQVPRGKLTPETRKTCSEGINTATGCRRAAARRMRWRTNRMSIGRGIQRLTKH